MLRNIPLGIGSIETRYDGPSQISQQRLGEVIYQPGKSIIVQSCQTFVIIADNYTSKLAV